MILWCLIVKPPKTIYIGITDRCNASCIMCWRRFKPGPYLDMDMGIIDKLMPYLKTAKMIGWWGDGEIFAHSNIDDILDIISSMPNVKHTFSTNGIGLYDYAEALSELNITHIQLSLDGATEETQEKIRRGTNFGKIIKGIKQINKVFASKNKVIPDITIMMVAMKSNVSEIDAMVRLAHYLGVSKVYINPLVLHSTDLQCEVPSNNDVKVNLDKGLQVDQMLGIGLEHCAPQLL